MELQEKRHKLAILLKQVAPEGDSERLLEGTEGLEGLEAMEDGTEGLELASEGLEKIARDHVDDLTPQEVGSLEAIVLPRNRPVVDIIEDRFDTPPSPWSHLGSSDAKQHIESAIPSVGRIELPEHPTIPYGGTGFVVGDGLIMTNRHVAEIFSSGLGVQQLGFRPGQTSGIDFRREVLPAPPLYVDVLHVIMIHPYWDMALLRVAGLSDRQRPLQLSTLAPDALTGRDIAVIGYPAQDARNDLNLQNRIFRGVFNVKRMQPGKLGKRKGISSFGNTVDAITHDSSTLGGNSGSAVVDVATGTIVGLHFAGRYLEANFAVPTYELARDARVVDAGANFTDSIPTVNEWEDAWRKADVVEAATVTNPAPDRFVQSPPAAVNTATWNIPLQISVTLGAATRELGPAEAEDDFTSVSDSAERAGLSIKPDPNYANRKGYNPDFLGNAFPVALPRLTESQYKKVAFNKNATADRHVLPYEHFSLVMNKKRRLAYFTAVNIDGKREKEISRDDFSDKWFLDPRIDAADQLQNDLYVNNRFDRGHLVRRLDPVWGHRFAEARKAHDDTFHWTNCSPQHEQYNRNRTTWGLVENWILENAHAKDQKVTVFTGPVLKRTDRAFTTRNGEKVKIPNQFWKIVVMVKHDESLSATAYLISQEDLIDDMVELPREPKSLQTTVKRIERLTKLSFGSLSTHDTLAGRRSEEGLEAIEDLELPITSLEQIVL